MPQKGAKLLYSKKQIFFSLRDTLRGETIGMIVGIVLAVLLLIVVCLVLIFLKATERLCFADNDQSYRYHDPKSKRAQPHNAQVSRLPKIFVG